MWDKFIGVGQLFSDNEVPALCSMRIRSMFEVPDGNTIVDVQSEPGLVVLAVPSALAILRVSRTDSKGSVACSGKKCNTNRDARS